MKAPHQDVPTRRAAAWVIAGGAITLGLLWSFSRLGDTEPSSTDSPRRPDDSHQQAIGNDNLPALPQPSEASRLTPELIAAPPQRPVEDRNDPAVWQALDQQYAVFVADASGRGVADAEVHVEVNAERELATILNGFNRPQWFLLADADPDDASEWLELPEDVNRRLPKALLQREPSPPPSYASVHTTGLDGWVRFAGPSPSIGLTVFASKPGTGTSGLWSDIGLAAAAIIDPTAAAPPSEIVVPLELHLPGRLHVSVVSREGEPIQGALVCFAVERDARNLHVTARQPDPITTGVDGAVEVELDAPTAVAVAAVFEGGQTSEQSVRIEPAGKSSVQLRAAGHYVISGHVLGPGDEPVAHAIVPLEYWDDFSPFTRTATDGAFTFEIDEPCQLSLVAVAKGYQQSEPVEIQLDDEQPQAQVTLRLVTSASIRGRVVWSTGGPVGGASVFGRATSYANGAPIDSAAADIPPSFAQTDASGAFELTDVLPDSSYSLVAGAARRSGERGTTVTVPDIAAGRTDVQLTLEHPAASDLSLSGLVTAIDTGMPIPAFAIDLYEWPAGTEPRSIAVTDPTGRFNITGLEALPYWMEIAALGYPRTRVGPVVPRAGAGELQVLVGLHGQLSVLVVDAAFHPVEGATVLLRRSLGDTLGDEFGAEQLIQSDANGHAVWEGCAPGPYLLQAVHGADVSDVLTVEVASGASVSPTLSLAQSPAPGRLSILVRSADGRPAASAQIDTWIIQREVADAWGAVGSGGATRLGLTRATQQTDASGTAQFDALVPGLYRLSVKAIDRDFPDRSVRIGSGQTATITLGD